MRRSAKLLSVITLLLGLVLSACAGGGSSAPSGQSSANGGQRKTLELWFWGASPAQQQTMQTVLVNGFHDAQDQYDVKVTFDNAVDKNVQVALTGGKGPDVVYGSGPSFSAAYAAQGKLADMTPYATKYGWKDRLLTPMYESGTVDGKLYSLPNSIEDIGVFYNQKVLDKLGVGVPKTYADLTAAMDKAAAAGLYPSVTGNKGWKPVNQNYISLFMTQVAGGKTMYDALQGKIKWTDPKIVAAVNASADFYKKGYLGGKDYANLNFVESMQLLAQQKSPFFIAPTLAFQFANDSFNDANGNTADLGYIPFPPTEAGAPARATLGSTASLSINAASANKDGAAMLIDYMMSENFAKAMNKDWPGYWAVPLKDFNLNADDYSGLSKPFVSAIKASIVQIGTGNFGFFCGTFFPPATAAALTDIDGVWLGTTSTTDFLNKVQTTFDQEKAKNLVPPMPQPAS